MTELYRTLPMHFIASDSEDIGDPLLCILEGHYQTAQLPRLVDMLTTVERDIILCCTNSVEMLTSTIFNLKLKLDVTDLKYAISRMELSKHTLQRLLGD